MMAVPQLLWTAVAGLGVGFIAGVFGLGGGFLIVPVLHVLLGIDIRFAVGAAACQVLGPATTSLLARRPQLAHFQLPLIVSGGQIVGTVLGAAVLAWSAKEGKEGGETIAGTAVPLMDGLVLILYLVILLSIGSFALWESGGDRRNKIRRGWLASWSLPPYCILPEFDHRPVSIPLLAWFGLAIGFTAGLLGLSGGMLLLPSLIYLWGLRTHDAIRAALTMVWIGAIPNTVAHAWNGDINLKLVMALLVGGTLGARLGSEFAEKLAGVQLRRRFGWLVLGAAGIVIYRLAILFSG